MSTSLLYGCGTSQGPQRPATYPTDIVLPGEANPPVPEAKVSGDKSKGARDGNQSSVWYAPQKPLHAGLSYPTAGALSNLHLLLPAGPAFVASAVASNSSLLHGVLHPHNLEWNTRISSFSELNATQVTEFA